MNFQVPEAAGQAERARRLSDLAEFVGGEIIGDRDLFISGVASIETALNSDITFALNEKFVETARDSAAACIIVPKHISDCAKTIMQVENPRFAFAKIATLFSEPQKISPGIHPTAVISSRASIGPEAAIGARVVVEDDVVIGDSAVIFPGVYLGKGSKVGAGTIIHANVTIEHCVVIGQHCIIHSGTVIGSDGFGFVENGGKHYKVPQIGTVIIEDNVEIGSNCSIDRAASGATMIKSGTKIDNLVHIAHNVVIGNDCLIIAQVGISGSVTVGDSVILAGQVGVAGHLEIGDRTVVAAKSGVTKSLPGRVHVSGFPAKPHLEEKKIMISLPKLPDLIKKVTQLTTAIQRVARRLDKIEGGRSS